MFGLLDGPGPQEVEIFHYWAFRLSVFENIISAKDKL
jgi:hypothetical protein